MIDDSAREAKLQLQQRRKKYDCTGRVRLVIARVNYGVEREWKTKQ